MAERSEARQVYYIVNWPWAEHRDAAKVKTAMKRWTKAKCGFAGPDWRRLTACNRPTVVVGVWDVCRQISQMSPFRGLLLTDGHRIEPYTAETIAKDTGLPLRDVRHGLNELVMSIGWLGIYKTCNGNEKNLQRIRDRAKKRIEKNCYGEATESEPVGDETRAGVEKDAENGATNLQRTGDKTEKRIEKSCYGIAANVQWSCNDFAMISSAIWRKRFIDKDNRLIKTARRLARLVRAESAPTLPYQTKALKKLINPPKPPAAGVERGAGREERGDTACGLNGNGKRTGEIKNEGKKRQRRPQITPIAQIKQRTETGEFRWNQPGLKDFILSYALPEWRPEIRRRTRALVRCEPDRFLATLWDLKAAKKRPKTVAEAMRFLFGRMKNGFAPSDERGHWEKAKRELRRRFG